MVDDYIVRRAGSVSADHRRAVRMRDNIIRTCRPGVDVALIDAIERDDVGMLASSGRHVSVPFKVEAALTDELLAMLEQRLRTNLNCVDRSGIAAAIEAHATAKSPAGLYIFSAIMRHTYDAGSPHLAQSIGGILMEHGHMNRAISLLMSCAVMPTQDILERMNDYPQYGPGDRIMIRAWLSNVERLDELNEPPGSNAMQFVRWLQESPSEQLQSLGDAFLRNKETDRTTNE